MRQFFIFLLVLPFLSPAQKTNGYVFESPVCFIQNQGQFNIRTWQKKSIFYAIDDENFDIFFSKTGLTYRFDKFEGDSENEHGEKNEKKQILKSEFVHITWLNSNLNTQLVAEDEVGNYFSYSIKNPQTKKVTNINYIKGYKKLIYKNLYPDIDVVYTFQQGKGLKYSLLLHPGADISQVKMKYSADYTATGKEFVHFKLDESGKMKIMTSLMKVTESQPIAFYKKEKTTRNIVSKFIFNNNVLSFDMDNFDNTKEVVIDPWVVFETANGINSSSAVWEVETDSAGNIYTTSNEYPMQLKKYNNAGILQWTYNTPWDTSAYWLGTLATTGDGITYITGGSTAEIEKIDNSGNMIWHNTGIESGSTISEYWSVIFNNNDTNKIIVGGTYSENNFIYYAAIYELDASNGDILGYQLMDSVDVSVPPSSFPNEVRSMAVAPNSKFVYLTHHYVASANQEFLICSNTYYQTGFDIAYAYKCEDFWPFTQNGEGLKSIIAGDNYFYVHRGDTILKYSLTDGTLLDSAAIDSGGSTILPQGIVIHNSGLDVDSCNNLYVGSNHLVIKFDEDLNVLEEDTVPFTVYDVKVNNNGEVIVVGAEYDNSNTSDRHGYIQSVNMNACSPYEVSNIYNPGICLPVDYVCMNDSVFNLISVDTGGIWSGTGIIDSLAGTFDPSVANIGDNVILYELPDGESDSVIITVIDCTPINVCYDSTNIVAYGGSMPFSWNQLQSDTTSILNEQDCIDCPSATPDYVLGSYMGCDLSFCVQDIWVEYDTGLTANIPATWPLMVTNNYDTLIFNSLSDIPYCTSNRVNLRPLSDEIKIYPNPVNHTLYVDCPKSFTMEITDISAKLILISKSRETDISNMDPGIYLVKIYGKNFLKFAKFIKE